MSYTILVTNHKRRSARRLRCSGGFCRPVNGFFIPNVMTKRAGGNGDSPVAYKAHRLAACTGLRIGELQGLRTEFVFDGYIGITGQYRRFGYVPNTICVNLIRREKTELRQPFPF